MPNRVALKKRSEGENAFETAAACLRPQDKAARAKRKGESFDEFVSGLAGDCLMPAA